MLVKSYISCSPKIKIENGAPLEENKKVPVYEVKPIKKESRKPKATLKTSDTEFKNKLAVGSGDSKKSHSKTKEQDKNHKSKEDKETKSKEKKRKETLLKVLNKSDAANEKTTKDDLVSKEKPTKVKQENAVTEITKPKQEIAANGACSSSVGKKQTTVIHRGALEAKYTKYSKKLNRHTKPPVVLVYSDSAVAKDNVKKALHDILNRERLVCVCFLQDVKKNMHI